MQGTLDPQPPKAVKSKAPPLPLTEKIVRDRLLSFFSPYKDTVAFNLTGIGPYGHEMDFVHITQAGYAREFEIKISKADIRKELTKLDKHDDILHGPLRQWYRHCEAKRPEHAVGEPFMAVCRWSGYRDRKHEELHIRYSCCVREFWVAVPVEAELAEFAIETLPEWVGVVEVGPKSYCLDQCVKRKAQVLKHARKITTDEQLHLYRRVYTRMWDLYHGRGGTGRGSSKLQAERRNDGG